MSAVAERLEAIGVVPVLVLDDPAHAEPLADALAAGGLPCAEVTFRTTAAAEAIRRMAQRHPDLLVGAGTVLTPGQVDAAADAGARFVVSPGFDPAVVEHGLRRGVDVFPGVCTPTDVQAALRHGLRTLKFFPAGPSGGAPYLRALAAPFQDVRFIPTGGVDLERLADYLSMPEVVACGGSWLAPRAWVRDGAFDRVRDAAREAVERVREVRAAAARERESREGGSP